MRQANTHSLQTGHDAIVSLPTDAMQHQIACATAFNRSVFRQRRIERNHRLLCRQCAERNDKRNSTLDVKNTINARTQNPPACGSDLEFKRVSAILMIRHAHLTSECAVRTLER